MTKLKIEHWPISRLKKYEKNARVHSDEQIAQIAASLKEFGFVNPVLVDADGVLIAGHGRLAAALTAGIETVPVITLGHLSEEQAKALRLADNRLPMSATWDFDLLRIELNDLAIVGYDLPLLGFETSEIADYMAAVPPADSDPEKTPETPTKPTSRPGDVWLLGRHRLLCGDCTRPDDVTAAIGKHRPILMVTDQPYGVEYDADWRNRADRANGKSYGASAVAPVLNDDRVDWTDAWKLFSGDVAYCWHAGRHASAVQSAFAICNFDLIAQVIWAKSRLIISRGDYHWQHEPAYYFVRRGKKHHWCGDRSQTTLWTIPHAKSETGHSTQKPVECMRRPIQNNSKPGEWVYDPFMGSGTTLIAAEMMKRNAIGIEINPAYVDVTVLRWQEFAKATATLEGDSRAFSEIAEERSKGKDHAKSRDRKPVRSGSGDKRADRPLAQ